MPNGSSATGLACYEWKIDGVCTYIGKYRSISRPKRAYSLNVARLLNNRPYRKSKPDQYRRIHRELAEAVNHGRQVTLTILENPPQHMINRPERELIEERGTRNGTEMMTRIAVARP